MKMKFWCLLFTALFSFSTYAKLQAQCQSLVWSDEFNDSKLNSTFWNIEVNGNGGGNNELQYYTARPENIRLEDGNLVIEARKESYLGKAYTSGRLTTQKKVSWKYGTIEARMKLPYGKGIWPAFWMLGESINTKSWPNCGEMDIMELVGGGAGDKTTHSTFHWGPFDNGGGHPSYGVAYSLTNGIFADDFHVFKMTWDNKLASTYVDGVKMFTIDISKKGMEAFHEKFFLLFNLAVGGNWPGSPDANTVFPQKMLIDYIRVYGGNAGLKIEGDSIVTKAQKNLTYRLPYDSKCKYAWTLPNGVTANGRIDSCVVSLNWGCASEKLTCVITTECGDYSKDINIKTKEYTITSSSFFIPAAGTDLSFTIPEMVDGTYNWSVPSEATLKSGQSTPAIQVAWGTNSGNVTLELSNTCETKTINIPVLKPGVYAYPNPLEKHAIPGSIESNDFNYGGEGIAYHDVEADNQGKGIRLDEGIDTEVGDNGFDIGWTIAGEWMTYMVKPVAGDYFAELRAASLPGNGSLTLSFNGVPKLSNVTIPSSGAWNVFQSVYLGPISLNEKDTLMKYSIVKGDFNIGRIIFWPKDLIAPTVPVKLTGVVSKTAIALKWGKSTDNQKLYGYKVFDNGVQKAATTDTVFSLPINSSVANHHVGIVAYDIQGNASDTLKADFKSLTTDLELPQKEVLRLYPNPATTVLNIESNTLTNSMIVITNATGQVIESFAIKSAAQKIELPIEKLKPGFYLVTIVEEMQKTTRSFIKQ